MTQQYYGLVQTTPPAVEPVLLADAKLWGKIDTTADDAIVTSLITAARDYAEDYTGRAFITQSYRLTLDRFPGIVGSSPSVYAAYRDWPIFWDLIRFPKPPLISVDSVQYVDTAGNVDVVDPSIYQADTDAEPGRLRPAYGQIWPVPRAQLAAVQIVYTCGYGTTQAAVPAGIQTAIKMLVETWYTNRGSSVGRNQSEIPFSLRAVLDRYWTGNYFLGVAVTGAY